MNNKMSKKEFIKTIVLGTAVIWVPVLCTVVTNIVYTVMGLD